MRLWEIAQKCKVANAKQFVINDGSETKEEISDKKLILTNTGSPLFKSSKKIISAVSSGRFPALG